MTLIQIEKRVRSLEQTVEQLVQAKPSSTRAWYRTHAGRFAGDRMFDEIVELGRAYREAQRPRRHQRRP